MGTLAAVRRIRRIQSFGLLVAAVSIAAVLLIMSHGFSKTLIPTEVEYKEVVVRNGDTLWQIAAQHRGADTDTRRMIDRIRDINDLSSAVVKPGQVLKVPVR